MCFEKALLHCSEIYPSFQNPDFFFKKTNRQKMQVNNNKLINQRLLAHEEAVQQRPVARYSIVLYSK